MAGTGEQDWRSRFIPGPLLTWSVFPDGPPKIPSAETFSGAMLLADISGFTRLTSQLSRDGNAGVEKLTRILDDFFTGLVALIERHGGTIFAFQGDSVLAGWRAGESDDVGSALVSACACAEAIRDRFEDWEAGDDRIGMRISLSAGAIDLIHAGDGSARCYFVPAGDAVDRVTRLGRLTESGEILVDEESWDLVADACTGERGATGHIRLLGTGEPDKPGRNISKPTANVDLFDQYLPHALISRLNPSMPQWLGELRTTTVCFMHIALDRSEPVHLAVNDIILRFHNNISLFDGEILHVAVNDGALEVLAVFGLPSAAHGDDPKRAVMYAMRVHSEIGASGESISAGIATGTVFCGPVGAQHRCDYTVLGQAVNRAARLLSVAAGRVLVDERTAASAERSITFAGPWPLHIAGIRGVVNGFVPTRADSGSGLPAADGLVNRHDEMKLLGLGLERLAQGEGSVVEIEGAPGIGKSALVAELVKLCPGYAVRPLVGRANVMETRTPYFAWRTVIRQCLELAGESPGPAFIASGIRRRLMSDPAYARFLPLLNDVLNLRLQESRATAELSRETRAQNLRRLLTHIISEKLKAEPCLLVLEDLHWLDEHSLSLAADLLRADAAFCLVTTRRPRGDKASPAFSELSGKLRHEEIRLDRLSDSDVATLCRRFLRGRSNLPDWLYSMLIEVTAGNPLFVSEICHGINQGDEDGGLDEEAAGEAADAGKNRLPDSVEAAIRSRMDRLSVDDQLVLKIASVIGSSFMAGDLGSLEPVRAADIDVEAAIDRLCGLHFFRTISEAPRRYVLRHDTIRNVAYQGLLSEQRIEVHAAIAEGMESRRDTLDVEDLPILLHHWRSAGNRSRTVALLYDVAELKVRQFDNEGAITHLMELLDIAGSDNGLLSRSRRAQCHLMLGEAYLSLGRMELARRAYEEGLALLDSPMPKRTAGLALDLLMQIAVQAMSRMTGGRPAVRQEGEGKSRRAADDFFLTAARAHEELTRIYYFAGDKLRLIHSTMRGTNLAERASTATPTLATNYASLGAICGVIPLRRQARHYSGRAAQLLDSFDSPTAAARVHLMAGMYGTSVGAWEDAKAHFLAGMEDARTIGDDKRWCELAVGLETISGPWLLTPAYSGARAWQEHADEICQVARAHGDTHVLGCGLLGRLRGNLALNRMDGNERLIEEIAELTGSESEGLELIHRLEANGWFAILAFLEGDLSRSRALVLASADYLDRINPGMKARTLQALRSIFSASMLLMSSQTDADEDRLLSAFVDTVLAKMKKFSKIFPIGRPSLELCRGDRFAARGRYGQAVKLWQDSLKSATEALLPLDGRFAIDRLAAASPGIDRQAYPAMRDFQRLVSDGNPLWGEVIGTPGQGVATPISGHPNWDLIIRNTTT